MKRVVFENGSVFSEKQVVVRRGACYAGLSSSVNWHDHIEFIYFTEGRGSAFLEDRLYPILPDTLIAVGPQIIHSISAEITMPYYIVFIHQSFFEQNNIDYTSLSLPEHTVADGRLKELLWELIESAETTKLRQARINSAALRLVLYLCDNYSVKTEESKKRTRSFERAKEVITFLKKNFDRRLTLDDIAREMNINKYQLARDFKQTTNVSIFEFLNSHRCSEAKKLLKQGLTVSEAAKECGFENLSYFSRTYKKYNGILPSEAKQNKIT